nr:MAG TPA: hypothetical protein [Caudoviricetes sp.]
MKYHPVLFVSVLLSCLLPLQGRQLLCKEYPHL